MDGNRMKYAAQWLHGKVFQDEPIQPRTAPKAERVPSLIRTARSLENNSCSNWQSRESIFLLFFNLFFPKNTGTHFICIYSRKDFSFP